jgi:hypothetical protein
VTIHRASQKKIEKLAGLLTQIQAQTDLSLELLQLFQAQYNDLTREERPWFFEHILRRIETTREEIEGPLQDVLAAEAHDAIEWSRKVTALRRRLESPRLRAFRRFLNLSGGFKFLLDFRADILFALRHSSFDLEPLDEELSHLFNTWFQHGFLFLQEITRDSSFRQIRFLKEHDMVHPMASLEEMGNRLGEDRRCFALYHRAMPEEPVVFIEAALTKGLARSIHEIIELGRPQKQKARPDTAIFYSINNTQNGLSGLGLGKVLIFQVVAAIQADHPGIKTHATLSPITGFWPRYLEPLLRGNDKNFALQKRGVEAFFSENVKKQLQKYHKTSTGNDTSDFASILRDILEEPLWIEKDFVRQIKKPLTEIAFYYISKERNRQGKPLNPVANFHLGNGATVRLKNIDFGANVSERGLADSCGMMVNYVYSKTWLQQIGRTMKAWLPWNQ